MISFAGGIKVLVATQPVDFRRGLNGLVALIAAALAADPYCGDVFVFRPKRRDRFKHGIGLRSLHEAIDTTTPTGKLTFHIFGALAEFERTLIRDRTQAGPAAARARGRTGGRRPVLNADKRVLAVRLYNERQTPISRICSMMGISKPTLYSYVRAANGVTDGPPAK